MHHAPLHCIVLKNKLVALLFCSILEILKMFVVLLEIAPFADIFYFPNFLKRKKGSMHINMREIRYKH